MTKKSASKRTANKKSAKAAGKKTGKKTGRKAKKKGGKSAGPTGGPQRLQRLLALAGFGSRRNCEEMVEEGRVELDGKVVTKLGTTADPKVNKILVDGVPLKKQRLVYYAVNKPVGVVTTNRDPQGRPRVIDLVPPNDRVFPVGRLDRSSEGLILLTNDGELAQRLTHPKFGVRKIYRVTVAGKVDGETMKKMRNGIYIAEGHVRVDGARLLKTRGRATDMEIVLREGKNREIRRILARLGHKVQHLRRIAVGPLRLGDMPAGAYRALSRAEVDKLWEATETSDSHAKTRVARKGNVNTRGTKKRGAQTKRGVKRGTKRGTKMTARSGRPPTKGSKKTKRKSSGDGAMGEINIGQTRSTGAVIGGDPSTKSERPKRKSKSDKGKRKGSSSKKARSSGGKKHAGKRPAARKRKHKS